MNINQLVYESQKILNVVEKPNFNVSDYKQPPKKEIITYRSKKLSDGKMLKFAIMKKNGPDGGKTKLTSIWRPK